MRWLQGDCGGCDALDAAAVWPSSATIAGFPLPEITYVRPKDERSESQEKKEAV